MNNRNKQSVLILGNLDSGLYDFRKEVLTALLEAGYSVHVSVPDTGYLSKIKALGCICHETVMERRGMNPVKDFKLFTFYVNLIKKVRPGVVLTYTIKPNIYGCLACRLLGVPRLVNITGLGTALENEGLLQKMLVCMYRESLKRAGCIFFQNRRNRDFMIEKGCVAKEANIRIIPGSGVNLQEHAVKSWPKEKEIRLLSVMRIMKDKGIEELLEVAQIIHREYPDAVFELVGSFEEETEAIYKPQIEHLQSEGIVRYYGYRDDVDCFYGRCQAVVHPSYHEGMSNVLQEAAASGRAVIAGNISGCREIFEDGVSGIAFETKSADSLTAALRSFLSLTEEERISMGQRARSHVEKHFDRKIVVAAYLEMVRELTR